MDIQFSDKITDSRKQMEVSFSTVAYKLKNWELPEGTHLKSPDYTNYFVVETKDGLGIYDKMMNHLVLNPIHLNRRWIIMPKQIKVLTRNEAISLLETDLGNNIIIKD